MKLINNLLQLWEDDDSALHEYILVLKRDTDELRTIKTALDYDSKHNVVIPPSYPIIFLQLTELYENKYGFLPGWLK